MKPNKSQTFLRMIMNYKFLPLLIFISLPTLSYEISIKRNIISNKKLNLINEARSLTLEQKKLLLKNSENYNQYQVLLNKILEKRKRGTIKALLYSKALQDKAIKLNLKVFNQDKISLFNKISKIENEILSPYLKKGMSYNQSQEELINKLKEKGYPLDSSKDSSTLYYELKELIRQEYIEKIRDEETAKAEYLLFHPKAKPNYFHSPGELEAERNKLREIYPKDKNTFNQYVFFPEQINKEVMDSFYYFSPKKVSLFNIPTSVHKTEIVKNALNKTIDFYLKSIHKPIPIKKQRVKDLANSSKPEEIFLKELYTFLLKHRRSTTIFYKYLKNVRDTFVKNDVPLSDIIPPKDTEEKFKRITLAFANYISSILPKVVIVEVSPEAINSTDVFIKAEKKINQAIFEKNKEYFIKYKLPRFLNYVHIRDGYRRINPESYFIY